MTDITALDALDDAALDATIRALREEIAALEKDWRLQSRQQRAEDLVESGEVFELLYGGAAGGGKSEWLLYHFYTLAQRFPGFNGLLLRRTFPELRRSLIMRSWGRFDPAICRYYASEHIWRFKNGSTIEFGYCESDADVYQYQSAEYDAIGWDELTQFPTDYPYTYLMSRCRTTVTKRAKGLRPHIVAGTNPGGVGGAWVKARFIDPMPPETILPAEVIVKGKARVVPRVFVPAKISDNAYLGDDYAIALANLNPALRAALEDGSWDTVEGQFFTEWDRNVHVVDPFEIPMDWPRIRGLDYGYTNPMCCLWGAIGPDGLVVIYRELYVTEHTPPEQARKIRAMSLMGTPPRPERVAYTVADPSVWTKTGAGPPIATQYVDNHLPVRKANNARIDGWARLRDYLRVDPRTKRPRLIVFSTCTNLLRTLPMLVHDQKRPEDLDTRGEDHAADALRYLVMSRPRTAAGPRPGEPRTPEERIWQRVRSKNRRRRSVLDGSPVGRL